MKGYADNVFRANVGAVILNSQGQVLALERSGIKGAWQMPQGGLEPGEEPWEGLLREIREETGIGQERLEKIAEYPDWLAYELPADKRTPKLGRGQVQKWFFLRLQAAGENDIDLEQATEPEFGAWRWMAFEDLVDTVVVFRRPLYSKLQEYFQQCRMAETGNNKEESPCRKS